jgi:hypothetical protein
MKTIQLLSLLFIVTLTSCSSVRVNADYDKKANFDSYKTYAYLKSGVDNAEISDLDKKRILYAIDEVMALKGFIKSENPDVLLSFFTQERERVNVYQNYGFGWGWGPWGGIGFTNVSSSPEGTLFIDFIDARNKELIWQGQGTGYLTENVDKKEQRVKEFVAKILAQYPPEKK